MNLIRLTAQLTGNRTMQFEVDVPLGEDVVVCGTREITEGCVTAIVHEFASDPDLDKENEMVERKTRRWVNPDHVVWVEEIRGQR